MCVKMNDIVLWVCECVHACELCTCALYVRACVCFVCVCLYVCVMYGCMGVCAFVYGCMCMFVMVNLE